MSKECKHSFKKTRVDLSQSYGVYLCFLFIYLFFCFSDQQWKRRGSVCLPPPLAHPRRSPNVLATWLRQGAGEAAYSQATLT